MVDLLRVRNLGWAAVSGVLAVAFAPANVVLSQQSTSKDTSDAH
jgi:hypothetical protein